MKFYIPYPRTKAGMREFCSRFSLNAIYSGTFWRHRKEDSEYWHEVVRSVLLQQRIPRQIFQCPVSITFFWNDNLDCSNHSYVGKMVEDAMKGWIIKDDSRRYVQEVRHKFYGGDCIAVEVIPI